MSEVVLDASGAVAWVLPSQKTAAADALLADRGSHTMIAPALFSLELRNILLAAERQGRIAAADVDLELSAIASFVETTPAPDEAALVQVLRLARGHGLNVYDASYLHLAVSRTATLASRDGALVNVCTRAGVQALDLR